MKYFDVSEFVRADTG